MMRPSFISWIQSHASAIAGLCVARSNALPRSCTRFLQQLKRALGVCGVEIAGRFVRQNDARIVCERTCDRDALLFASGKMTAGPSQLVAQAYPVKQIGSAIAHLAIRKLAKLTHRDHHIFLRSEVLHQEMELKDEADEFAPLCASSSSLRWDTASDSIATRPASGISSKPRM